MNELEKAQLAVEQANQAVLAASETIQKLVAENAAMRKAINETIGWQESVDASNTESVRLLVAIQTPATDAAIAEIKAQGVDELIEENRACVLPFTSSVRHQFAADFAANLRAGSKG